MSKEYSFILFDLDGTLTDPEEGITKSVEYALRHFGINVGDRSELYKFIGPPLKDSFIEYYGFTEKQADEALLKYRERFSATGWRENVVYDGIKELLGELREEGKKIMLATSKPEVFAERILSYFGLRPYFSFVGGATLDGSRNHKTDVIRYVLEKNEVRDTRQAVMVGDRKFDVQGGKECGLSTIGVLYGYGDRAELAGAGADRIVSSVAELQSELWG